MDQIVIRKLKIFAHHGVFPEEKQQGQFFYLTAYLRQDLRKAGMKDDLSKSINYADVMELLDQTMREENFDTIEAAAESCAEKVLLRYPSLNSVRIQVEKPEAPVNLDFDTVLVDLERSWHTAYIGLGSNLGNRQRYLDNAISELKADESIVVEKVSSYENTEPYGPVDQPDFLNAVAEIRTLLTPHELLTLLHDLENEAGRKRTIHWGPRTLDLDILLYDDQVISDSKLQIPHPEMTKRKFVLAPMNEIAPFVRHPVLHKTMKELLEELGNGEENVPYYDEEYTEVDTLLSEGVTVVYAGVPGAYAEEAAVRYFGKQGNFRNVRRFDDVVSEVSSGSADYGILPMENSSAGFVNGNYDIIRSSGVKIVAEVVLDISHCLLALPGAHMSDIRKVYSHPQGLMQCRDFIEEHDLTAESVSNTALAARKVKESGQISIAAIASERSAELYGLKVLRRNVNFSQDNSTRFVIVTNRKIFLGDATGISLSFTAQHKVGALYDIMGKFYSNRLNMTRIESRPSLKRKWEYIFYVDFEGKLTDRNVKKALGEIQANTDEMSVLGTY